MNNVALLNKWKLNGPITVFFHVKSICQAFSIYGNEVPSLHWQAADCKLLLFPHSLSDNFPNTEKTACPENLICANTVVLDSPQKNDRKGISCFSKATSLSRWVPALPAGFPSHSSRVSWERSWLMACQRWFVITPHLQEVLHSRNSMDSIGELTLMNKWEYFVICTSRQAYSKRWDVRQQ